jgi:hypothetical protein
VAEQSARINICRAHPEFRPHISSQDTTSTVQLLSSFTQNSFTKPLTMENERGEVVDLSVVPNYLYGHFNDKKPTFLTNIETATSHASAQQQTALSKPRTMPRYSSPSVSWTRTVDTRARTRPTLFAASCVLWARATMR